MLDVNAVITASLTPAVGISGVVVLIFGLNNRLTTIATRVRDLNRELRQSTDARRHVNVRQQIPLFLKRAYLVRNAMFLLFGALGMMVFTAFAIALSKLHYVHWERVPAWTFLVGLLMMLTAVLIEAYETMVNLETLSLDVSNSLMMSDEAGHDEASQKRDAG